jgi:hypothetical protein
LKVCDATFFGLTGHHQDYRIVDENYGSVVALLYFMNNKMLLNILAYRAVVTCVAQAR